MIRGSEDKELERRRREEALLRPRGGKASRDDDGVLRLADQSEQLASQARQFSKRAAKAMPRRRALPSSSMAAPLGLSASAALERGGGGGGASRLIPSYDAPPPTAAPPHREVTTRSQAAHLSAAAPPHPPPSAAAAGSSIFTDAVSAPATGPAPASAVAVADGSEAPRDLSHVPVELDAAYEAHDDSSALRATVIAPSGDWAKKTLTHLLAKAPTHSVLRAPEQAAARGAAFDLIDALSRSGGLPMASAALHVVMGATHAFDESLLDTVVQGNVNPIERVERSLVIMAATLHGLPAVCLLRDEHVERLRGNAPSLFVETAAEARAEPEPEHVGGGCGGGGGRLL